ncbi:GH25 family lysozyme [Amycolatopsis echigonensis]|uniref:GH25 family lysozyme n=1 Tax=Amycolatopsis echigonensis TaxID=2576905 RepID=UPI0028ADDE0A|nr:GH25 family lysozyme [Amycolatopsis echigonensis]
MSAGAVSVLLTCALAGTPAAASTDSTSPSAPAHPDSDYLGSTIGKDPTATPKTAPRTAMASGVTTPGMDVSHYQGTVDWGAAAGNGAKFAYLKATESTTYVDPQFTANYAGSANAGILRGAYHFGLPDTSTGAAQAQFFLSHGGGWVADGKTLPPVLDIEYNPYSTADWTGWCYNMTPAQISAWITDFTTTIHDRTNRWPVIYTTNGWWNHCTGNNPGFANDPLWIAGTVTMPASWTDYTFNQTASSGTFPGDQDVFNGSVSDLQALATGAEPDKITEHYNALGGPASYLGSPVGTRYPAAGGWAQNYQYGVIGYNPPTGAYAVHGAIAQHYQELAGPTGFLGLPTTDETLTPDASGSYNHFTNSASIYWTSTTGARSIHGAIRDKWAALGWERGLGYPTTDETGTPDGTGRYNHFNGAQGASVYWTPATGAQSIHGAIRQKWAALGWERGLGYPTTDETGTPDGTGRYNHFNGAQGASVYWTPATGAQSIHGAIRQKWAALGWEKGPLGYPTSDEYGITGGRRNTFQHGTITWYSANGTTQVAYN